MEKYQTIFARICAVLLDNVLLLPLLIVDYWVRKLSVEPRYILTLLFIVSLFNIFYYIVMHAVFGQTVGKMLMKVKVFDISGTKISFRQSIIRNLPQIILLIGSFIFLDPLAVMPEDPTPEQSMQTLNNPFVIIAMIWNISDIIFFFINDKNRALHDLIAGTIVTRVKDEEM